MRSPNQKMRFTDEELGLLKALFADNDTFLYLVRTAMLQGTLSDQDKITLQDYLTEPAMSLLRKVFVPNVDTDSPLFQLSDLVLQLGADIKGLSPEGAWPLIKAKEIEVDYLNQQLHGLTTTVKPRILLSELKEVSGPKTKREEIFTNVTARNFLLSWIDTNIQQIKFLAGQQNETVEQTKTRLARDSAK